MKVCDASCQILWLEGSEINNYQILLAVQCIRNSESLFAISLLAFVLDLDELNQQHEL